MEGVIFNNPKIQISVLTKERIVIAIRWLCMALFLYTAYAKIADHERFFKGLTKVHLISRFAMFLSIAVPFVEIIIGIMLIIPITAKVGLHAFTVTMTAFTLYIISALIWENDLPCHCGGAIEKLTWSQHIWFNIAFIAIALFALGLLNKVHSLKIKNYEKF